MLLLRVPQVRAAGSRREALPGIELLGIIPAYPAFRRLAWPAPVPTHFRRGGKLGKNRCEKRHRAAAHFWQRRIRDGRTPVLADTRSCCVRPRGAGFIGSRYAPARWGHPRLAEAQRHKWAEKRRLRVQDVLVTDASTPRSTRVELVDWNNRKSTTTRVWINRQSGRVVTAQYPQVLKGTEIASRVRSGRGVTGRQLLEYMKSNAATGQPILTPDLPAAVRSLTLAQMRPVYRRMVKLARHGQRKAIRAQHPATAKEWTATLAALRML
jgi:hypothetical protein